MSITVNSVSRTLSAPRPSLAEMLAGAWVGVKRWYRIASTRQGLTEMDDRMLADLGISRAQAEFELQRLPWTRSR